MDGAQPADEIRRLEERLLDPGVRASRDALIELLAYEFVEFGSSGRVFDRATVIDALADEADIELSLSEFRTKPLAPAVVLATYRTTERSAGRTETRQSRRSSLWVHRSGRWQLLFHQGTPIPGLG